MKAAGQTKNTAKLENSTLDGKVKVQDNQEEQRQETMFLVLRVLMNTL
jgi:hypothetical protein